MGEEEVGESTMERLALEKEGEGVGAVLSQPAGSRDSGMDWQTKEQDLCLSVSALLELEWRPVVKTLPGSQLPTGLLETPSCEHLSGKTVPSVVNCLNTQVPGR